MKKILLGILVAGCWISSYATDARVIAMGRHDDFFMDEVSIFKNPANISIYPNMVYGSYGVYRFVPSDTLVNNQNRDPVDPFFGAIVSYSLNQNTENRNQYPMISVGAVFNRHDEMLDYITKGSDKYIGNPNDSLLAPSGKADLLFSYALKNGGMIGAGAYFAMQSVDSNSMVLYETSVYKGNIGINWPVAKSTNLEISVGAGVLRAKGDSSITPVDALTNPNGPKIYQGDIVANNNCFVRADIRLFSAMTMLNGDFVPHLSLQRVTLHGGRVALSDVAAGLGLNINIDKGFFWAGIEGLYKDYTYGWSSPNDSTKNGIGGRVSFGIERSIWWDWFVIRVGGQKTLLYTTTNTNSDIKKIGRWDENAASDASDNDLVGLGFGLNVENRLRIDVVAAEDIPYTLAFVSGPRHHLFTRVSATYSF
jgi:hypothetical protein